jgi:hypothetical protein
MPAKQNELLVIPPNSPHGLEYRSEFLTHADEHAWITRLQSLPFKKCSDIAEQREIPSSDFIV